MQEFEEYISSIKIEINGTQELNCNYGESKCGQRFAILITKKFKRFAVHVIMDEDHRELCSQRAGHEWIIRKNYPTETDAITAANNWKTFLENGEYDKLTKDAHEFKWKPRIITLPKDCAENPDKYLKPGDVIQSNFGVLANHEGIYIGNGEVIHVSSHGDLNKRLAKAQVGKVLGHFVYKATDTIRLKIHRLRYRSPLQIIFTAKKYAKCGFRFSEYDILSRNCQHFAYLCTHGIERSDDVNFVTKAIYGFSIIANVAFI